MRDKQFSYEEKVDIVREHEEAHKTLIAICEEYDISKSYLCYLLKEYREKGRKAFKDTKSHTAAQKLEIIKRHYEDGITIAELVHHRVLSVFLDSLRGIINYHLREIRILCCRP